MHSPPALQEGLSATQTAGSLLGVTAVCLVIAVILRRRVPAAAASLERRPLVKRLGGGPKAVGHGRTALAWASLLLFAGAGIAAEGTFIGASLLWLSRTTNDLAHHLPWIGRDIAGAGFSIFAVIVLWKAGHLVFDLLEGKAHHGGSDWLVFSAPTVFPLVPGFFGRWSTTLFSGLATHVAPYVQSHVR